MKHIFLITIGSLLLLSSTVSAQDYGEAVRFMQKFKQVQENVPRESVYLHTDRDWYFLGERIWFSAYVKSGGYISSNLSDVLYVELIQPDGKILDRSMVKIEGGRANGSLTFENAEEILGNYEIRAYTKWGLNFGPSYEFIKHIKVKLNDQKPQISSPDKFDIQFFPESGFLIDDIPTKLAFKAIDGNGLGIDVSGSIYDHNDEKISEFETAHLGMGAIHLLSQEGSSYYAIVDDQRFDLPASKEEGVIMNVSQKDDYFELSIKASKAARNAPYLLFAHVRGTIYHAAPIDLKSGNNSLVIPAFKFASGIVNFTLLEGSSGKAIAERPIFNKNPIDEVTVNISAPKQDYESRESVNLNIEVLNADGQKVNATASVSVFDDLIEVYDSDQTDIQSFFLLESELKGHVEDPGFYFSENDSADAYMDYLMLTQAWKAYDMEHLIPTHEMKMVDQPENGISVTGIVKTNTLFRDRPIENASIIADIANHQELTQITTSDSLGKFSITGLNFYGGESMSIKANKEGSDRIWIEIDEQNKDLPNKRPKITQRPLFPIEKNKNKITDLDELALQERSDQAVEQSEEFVNVQMSGDLGEISVSGKREEDETLINNQLSELGGRGSEIYVQEKEHLKNLPVEMILNQIPGVSVVNGSIRLRTGFTSVSSGNIPPTIYVDGIIADPGFVFSLSPNDIEKISVARSSVDLAAFGANGAGGVISIQTFSKGFVSANEPGFKRSYLIGYQEPTEFYAPKYGITVPPDYELRDTRITLHWDPALKIESNINNDIRFWMNDVPSTYRLVIQGLTEAGDPFTHSAVIDQN